MKQNEKLVYDFFSRPLDPGMDFSDEPRITQQEFAEEVNINQIIERAEKTQQSLQGDTSNMFFGDFSEIKDYQSALEQIEEANVAFMRLPAKTRAKFSNNPANLLQYVEKGENVEEALELGLLSEEAANRIRAAKEKEIAAKAAQTSKAT